MGNSAIEKFAPSMHRNHGPEVAPLGPVWEVLMSEWASSNGSYLEKTYIIDIKISLPDDWQELRGR